MARNNPSPQAGLVNGVAAGGAEEKLSPVMPDVAPDRGRRRLAQARQSMRRFCGGGAELPLSLQSHCLGCDEVVASRFELIDGQVVLIKDCGKCGQSREVHYDAIFSEQRSDRAGSAESTFSGTKIRPVIRSLPRTVQTLCPQCGAILIGRYYVAEGKVLTEKTATEVDQEILEEVNKAVQFAEESPLPEPEETLEDVYA